MKRYWMVHNPSNCNPTQRHDRFESARKEAERLARKTGQAITILEAVMVCEPVHVPVEWKATEKPISDVPVEGPETFDMESMS